MLGTTTACEVPMEGETNPRGLQGMASGTPRSISLGGGKEQRCQP